MAAFLIDAWEGAMLRAKVEQSKAPLETFVDVTFKRILG
jgi:TetR/AcrR family transcriptional regulator, transcriptional repressor for nem operon